MARTHGAGRRRFGGDRVPHMWSHAANDSALVPDPALPAQVYHLWHHSGALAPTRALALAVLEQAVEDVHRYRRSGLAHHRRWHDEALAWIGDDARDWPYAFCNLCDAFGLDIGEVRAQLAAGTSRGALQAA